MTASIALAFLPLLSAQALAPAGSINGAIGSKPAVVVAPDDPAVLRYVTAIRDRLFAGAELVVDASAGAVDLRGRSALVYTAPDQPWFRAHAAAVPFSFDGDTVTIDGRRFTGARLRVIAALRSPVDAAQKVVLYAAARPADLVEIHAVFHGPTEWVVADGTKVLAAGSFTSVQLSVDAMQRDLDDLVATIEAVHPSAVQGLPAAVAAAADTARRSIAPGLQRADFARLCGSVLLALGDAHSALRLPRSGVTLALPFAWLPSGPVVTTDCGELRAGEPIVRFAGRDPQQLLAILAAHVPAENHYWLQHQAPVLLSDLGLLRLFGIAADAPVKVRVAGADGVERDVEVPAGPLPQRPAPESWVRFTIEPEHSLGVFTLDRCTVDRTYRDALDEFFVAVHEQQITRIAVDLRANSGGNSAVVDEFLRYLDVEEYRSFSGDVRWSAAALQQRGESGAPRFQPARPVKLRNARHGDPPPFRGELFVLIGPATFSSAKWFAVVVHDNGLGTIVGEPTGNAPSSYGDVLSFTLPASALGYTLSFKRWVRPDPSRDPAPCLEPQVHVPRTAASIRAGTDPVLEWLRSRSR